MPRFELVPYAALNDRQKENHNYQKVSGVLADYGFSTVRLTDDWNGADFIAQHHAGRIVLRVQLKPRLFFSKKYEGKELWMCFPNTSGAYLFPHDEVLSVFLNSGRIMRGTSSWDEEGSYSIGKIAKWMVPVLQPYHYPATERR